MLTNREIRSREIYKLNEQKLNLLKSLRISERDLLVAIQNDIKECMKGNKTGNKALYRQALSNYIDFYTRLIQIDEDIHALERWQAVELECY